MPISKEGIHWSIGPLYDPYKNYDNPVTTEDKAVMTTEEIRIHIEELRKKRDNLGVTDREINLMNAKSLEDHADAETEDLSHKWTMYNKAITLYKEIIKADQEKK